MQWVNSQFPQGLLYKNSIYFFHIRTQYIVSIFLSLLRVQFLSVFPAPSITLIFLLVIFFIQISFATLAFTKSDISLELKSSSSSRSLLQHLAASLHLFLIHYLAINIFVLSTLHIFFNSFFHPSYISCRPIVQDFFIFSFLS